MNFNPISTIPEIAVSSSSHYCHTGGDVVFDTTTQKLFVVDKNTGARQMLPETILHLTATQDFIELIEFMKNFKSKIEELEKTLKEIEDVPAVKSAFEEYITLRSLAINDATKS